MNVTAVSFQQTEAAAQAGRPCLTPELMAASGARYSRNNEGLAAILERIDPDNLDRSVDSIFRMLDYGHQSIADMVPVAMFMDNLSIWLAYYVWSLVPTAGGQESSTRYLELADEALLPAETAGLDEAAIEPWQADMRRGFAAYNRALAAWDAIGTAYPELTSIPKELLAAEDEKSQKTVARMLRNFRFDRARYYLPAAARTNVMLVMSARGWATLCQNLCSHPLREANLLGDAIREELAFSAPRLMKHATAKPYFVEGLADELLHWSRRARAEGIPPDLTEMGTAAARCEASLEVMPPADMDETAAAQALKHHANRYAYVGPALQRTGVRYGWTAMTLAEIRDLNRHRTGTKHCPFIPKGFYGALDQLPADAARCPEAIQTIRDLHLIGRELTSRSLQRLASGDATYVYWSLLGTQLPFERTTTADKMLYEAELRTGLGAHYRYAQHYHDLLALWYARYPTTRGLIIEGAAEPE